MRTSEGVMVLLPLILAWVYGHLLEYSIHRWVLHPFGKRKSNPLSFHWKGHHRHARSHHMLDGWSWREVAGVAAVVGIHLPTALISPWFAVGLVGSGVSYLYTHTRAHSKPNWALSKVPWHYAHHMGRVQDANWGVRSDWVDRLAGTRLNLNGERY